METTKRGRLTLVIIMLVFAAPLLVALALNLAGWRPEKTRNYGTLVQPPVDVSAVPVAIAGGGKLDWRDPQWHWTLLALPDGACGEPCQTRLAEVMRMRITLGRNAERLRVVYIGAPLTQAVTSALAPLIPAAEEGATLDAYRPQQPGALGLALVDPNGLLILRYGAGYDAARLRADVVRVAH